ncbi:uncharacterized protein LOC118112536 isoform X2 [Hippoglossus stenolepis]|uniref:uncharacterized protein LOC118112536 isoform X2 n=1 Tax=Hippoglossus stenolepis TaxID=195615 RepID=UPI001FAFCFBB|nr:uncharacterized protein LOC118112536 isoform X2 [Hippoglossus stenolepis]
MSLQMFQHDTFRRHARMFLEPAINHKWKKEQQTMFEELKQKNKIAVVGDVRADSPDTAYIVLLAMEGPEPTTRATATGQDGNQAADQKVLMTSKPLHRFIRKEPKALGIVILIFGCAEILMGFHLTSESVHTSGSFYIPFWQGILFLVSGKLSIYTEIHPSKKMVTVCLAMYVVSLLGAVISIGFRMYCLSHVGYLKYRARHAVDQEWAQNRIEQLFGVEGLLFTSSLCAAGILIFLSSVARLALKSTNTQVIVRCTPAPAQSDATPN